VFYLHHRDSEDLDFFSEQEVELSDLRPFLAWSRRQQCLVDWEVKGPRRMALIHRGREKLKVDFSYYPFPRVERGFCWNKLSVDSEKDIAVNKIQAMATRLESKDFIDFFVMMKRHSHWRVEELRRLTRIKFDVNLHPYALGEKFLQVDQLRDFPVMHEPFDPKEFRAFFLQAAADLAKK